jgi:hypothetical protein
MADTYYDLPKVNVANEPAPDMAFLWSLIKSLNLN